MLAYVFWHWRRRDVDAASYVEALAAFHETLGLHPPQGFLGSACFRGGAAAWMPGKESYEDWYLIKGSQALDPLNDGAVSGSCRAAHGVAARAAGGGTAGLYRLRLGSAGVTAAGCATWFPKPDGLSYDAFFEMLDTPCRRARGGLWGRQMVLGPTPEFCLLTPKPMELPSGWKGSSRPLERLWPRVRRPVKRRAPQSARGPR